MRAISVKFYALEKRASPAWKCVGSSTQERRQKGAARDRHERSPPEFAMRKDARKAIRSSMGKKVWIRFDDGFSVRECRLVDLSASGIRIRVRAPHDVATQFSVLLTRDASPGRRCWVKWRRGQEIGAEYVPMGEHHR